MRDNKGRFVKGITPWHKGKKVDKKLYPNYGHQKPHSEETKQRMSEAKKGKHYSPDTEFKEKTGFISYSALHNWVYRKLGKATKCINGHENQKQFVWANISGEYKRDITDWKEVCQTCNVNDGIKIHERYQKN